MAQWGARLRQSAAQLWASAAPARAAHAGETHSQHAPVDEALLTAIVRAALDWPHCQVAQWRMEEMHGGASRESKVFRCTGSARASAQSLEPERPWSVVVKVSRRVEAGDAYAGLREAMAYAEGLLPQTGPLRAPHCYHVEERHAAERGPQERRIEERWVWMEDVAEQVPVWAPAHYAAAARALGAWNGRTQSHATHPWLVQRRLRRWTDLVAPAMERLPRAFGHPLLRLAYPPDVANGVLRLWAERAPLLARLEALPAVLCHGDAFRRNLFAGTEAGTGVGAPAGVPQIIAVDWAQIGAGPVGEELAPLLCAGLSFGEFDGMDVPAMEQTLVVAYLEGLRAAGWQGDERAVRLGFAGAAALRYGLGVAGLILAIVSDERRQQQAAAALGRPIEGVMAGYAEMMRAALALADQARALLAREQA